MKRTYFKGCEWCNATGVTVPMNSTTALTSVCPVCDGSGKILVTEETKHD